MFNNIFSNFLEVFKTEEDNLAFKSTMIGQMNKLNNYFEEYLNGIKSSYFNTMVDNVGEIYKHVRIVL